MMYDILVVHKLDRILLDSEGHHISMNIEDDTMLYIKFTFVSINDANAIEVIAIPMRMIIFIYFNWINILI